ncbi:outer membrane protein assembly factor BamB [Marinicella gelatinilytica]|uniref:outer membrane protein assembly factor BamB n=1 Tax=Marinicella gelatinilytica TaxID=2996017 RepID=UPI002260A19F|nr:outer membrane protein assembly factor BamB [Marinicella gelatinilytica]MCX7544687.1 outer membrane protein assembly factor BamB [Marinicella gelatinilytica]
MRLILFILILFLTACGSKKDEIKPNELTDFTETGSFKLLWQKKLKSSKDAYGYQLRPAPLNKALFTADVNGGVYRYGADNGQLDWKTNVDHVISAGPGVSDTLVVVAGPDGQVTALDADSGSTIWQKQVSSEVLSPPVIDRNRVIVRSMDGRIYGLNISNGERQWLYSSEVPNLTLRGTGTPLSKGGRLYVGLDGGDVVALNILDGQVMWQQNVVNNQGKTEIDRLSDIDGDMGVVATDLYVSSAANKTLAVATESGQLLWRNNHGSNTGVTVSRRFIYLADNESIVRQIDRSNGELGWVIEDFKNRELSRPAFYLGDLLITDFAGYVHVIDAFTGKMLNRKQFGKSGFYGAPVVDGNTIYTYNKDGTLSAFRYSE